jgi:hypothetical protein
MPTNNSRFRPIAPIALAAVIAAFVVNPAILSVILVWREKTIRHTWDHNLLLAIHCMQIPEWLLETPLTLMQQTYKWGEDGAHTFFVWQNQNGDHLALFKGQLLTWREPDGTKCIGIFTGAVMNIEYHAKAFHEYLHATREYTPEEKLRLVKNYQCSLVCHKMELDRGELACAISEQQTIVENCTIPPKCQVRRLRGHDLFGLQPNFKLGVFGKPLLFLRQLNKLLQCLPRDVRHQIFCLANNIPLFAIDNPLSATYASTTSACKVLGFCALGLRTIDIYTGSAQTQRTQWHYTEPDLLALVQLLVNDLDYDSEATETGIWPPFW